jgi:hypothetical protein
MSTSEDRWFEVWFDQGEDVLPTWLLIVTPDVANPGLVLVHDPFENRIVHRGQNYKDTRIWLAEDEYSLASGRMFHDETYPLATKEED